MNNNVFVFSGASHSGKTTFMNYMKKKYPDKIVLINEVIRDLKIKNIDEIRKNPYEYLKLQFKIINKKINDEKQTQIDNKYKNKIILVDRSLVDSFFYYTFYVDKALLKTKELHEYHDFLKCLILNIREHFDTIYSKIFMFEPIVTHTRKDKFTQSDLKITQQNEFETLKIITKGFNNKNIVENYNALTDRTIMETRIMLYGN